MKTIIKIYSLFFISVLIILALPFITKAEEWATYGNETNVSYPDSGVNCSFGQIHPNQSAYWCWINFSEKTMDHSFTSFAQMDAYYNSSGDGVVIGGDGTFTLSGYEVGADSVMTSGDPGMLSGIFAFFQGLFL